MAKIRCSVCKIERDTGITVDTSISPEQWADRLEVHRTTVSRHLGHAPNLVAPSDGKGIGYSFDHDGAKGTVVIEKRADRIIPLSEWLKELDKDLRENDIPHTVADFTPSVGHSVWGQNNTESGLVTLYANRFTATLKRRPSDILEPLWPVIEQAQPVTVVPVRATETVPRAAGLKLGLKCGDTQIGFRRHEDGTLDTFHDPKAMALFVEACRLYQPDVIHILGDFLDMAEQGRFAQEASFANTTQMSLNAGHRWLAEIRAAAPGARIVLIEGNHDLRLQNFVEANAKAAFGLKQANMPESWPVMSLPFLLRLAEIGVEYIDSYPAATDWDNSKVRNIHGTKANSKGSTMAQYVHELPHVSTWAGHTHRAEVVYRTVLGDFGQPIESYAANPGVLCRVDGGVPSVKGAIGSNGRAAAVVEDWQQGIGFHYFNETESWPSVYRIKDGVTLIGEKLLRVPDELVLAA